jgi:predicted NAD/FAD-binding protein
MSSHLPRQRIAVVGAGIAGNTAAWALSKQHDVTLFEAQPRFGGHANTVDVMLGGVRTPVDTGFIVYNQLNYPHMIKLFDVLGVKTEESNMSFGISLDQGDFEYRSDTSVEALFAQKRNALRPRFWRMLLDIKRFYGQGPKLGTLYDLNTLTLGELLTRLGTTPAFQRDHLIPMAACIWSASTQQILTFPAATFVRFFVNHGLFQLEDRPIWRTVTGGSREYVTKLINAIKGTTHVNAPVRAIERQGSQVCVYVGNEPAAQHFDQVVLATHGNEALSLLANPTPKEQEVLRNFRYSSNHAYLHRDKSLMPRRRAVWSSWNYVAPRDLPPTQEVPITYWMNSLQNLDPDHDIFVSLNPIVKPQEALIEQQMVYTHPIFDHAAIQAQSKKASIQGTDRIWYAGSYWGYGFHEDACASGIEVAQGLGIIDPFGSQWRATPRSPLPEIVQLG